MASFTDVQTTKVGAAGLVLLPGDKSQSPWIQNLVKDTDGSWIPRFGLKLIKDYSARIAMLGSAYQPKSGIQRHVLYVVTEEPKLYKGSLNTIASDTGTTPHASLTSGDFSNEQKNASVAVGTSDNPTATEKRVCFSWQGIGGFADAQIYDQTGGKVQTGGGTDVKGIPFAHGNTLCFLQKATIAWTAYGNAYDLTDFDSFYTYLPPEIGEGVGAFYWQEDVSYIIGTTGACIMQGSPLEQSLRFRVLTAPPAALGSAACFARCRDRLFYLAPGPSIFLVGGGLQRVDQPIFSLLKGNGDVSNYQMFYDPLIDCLCVAIYVSGGPCYTYLYSLAENKWIGLYSHADNTRCIGKAVNAGGLTNSDSAYRNRSPFATVAVAAGDLLEYYDSETYGDDTAAATNTAFPVALETAPEGAEEFPFIDKQLLDVYVDGTGDWTVKVKTRDGGGSYTTTTIGTVTAPGWVHASSSSPVYKERIVRAEASSASGVRIKSMTIREAVLGG